VQVCWQEVSRVAMKPLTDAELAEYVASGAWEGKSGAYAVAEDDPFVRVVAGSFSNVVGLPMESLARALAWLTAAPPA
jgi:septum formation protein